MVAPTFTTRSAIGYVSGGNFRPNGTNCWVTGSTKAIAEQARKQETNAYTIHTIVCGRASADTTIYIRCGTSEGRYVLGGP